MPVEVTHAAPRHAPDLQHPRARARTEGTAALDGRVRDAGQRERRLGEGIGGVAVLRLGEYPAPPQQAQDAGADGGDEPADLGVGGRRGRVKGQRAVGGLGEDPSSANVWA